ncbi:hypothetical protein OnM2_056055 [Erysiphe neolycopersici]|uniref:Uncharacterized protein n=1 Tax=Erysiphe neolycopersici TaxID=212602 RepID=A0A420HR08_9PEZI|nr:hypothetical protein OnM2_056055 [Erysiphe neolycopersici]
MGTRGLLGLIIGGKRRGIYNHWDSYPSGLGKDIVKFILSLKPEQWDEMVKILNEITWVSQNDEADEATAEKYLALGYGRKRLLEFDDEVDSSWTDLLNDCRGADNLIEMQKGNLKHAIEAVHFHQDTLFCEWAYFIDFEKRTLESYQALDLLDTVSFDDLKEVGLKYIERLEKACRADAEEEEAMVEKDH